MSLNERGAFYHLIGDAGGSLAVIVSTIVIEVSGVRIVDPITAALIAVVVTWSAVKVLRGSGAIFLHRTPLDPEKIRSHLLGVEGVKRSMTSTHGKSVAKSPWPPPISRPTWRR